MGYNEEKQRQLDMRYLRMARIWAENSYCVRRKVGALIVKDKMIISDGYNGTPSGFENVCEDENGKTKPYVLHAEANAITKVAKSANNCDGSTLYITAAPCIECSKLIKPQHIQKAEAFYAKHGHKAIFLARFAPIVRTLAPFVAGIGSMHYRTFAIYNVTGAVTWVFLFVGGGYLFGNMPWVKNNFSHVTLGIIIFSLLPIFYETHLKGWLAKRKNK